MHAGLEKNVVDWFEKQNGNWHRTGQFNCSRTIVFFFGNTQSAAIGWMIKILLDGLSNVNEALILSNMLCYYLLFVFVPYSSIDVVGFLFGVLFRFKCALSFSLVWFFASRSNHFTDTKAPKHSSTRAQIHVEDLAIFYNSLTFLVMRTNEHQKEESALTASNHRIKKSHPNGQ